ncbi:hypothetical protein AMECASPLE_035565 [Ameca splendens]|uniref:Uncharacterized protein n=1 Tax=Ameca splendens TaxID=208324 RepID=A0ABV0Z763_9TELE
MDLLVNSNQLPNPYHRKGFQQHDAATTMLHGGDGDPSMACGKSDNRLLIAFFLLTIYQAFHSSIRARFVDCKINSCATNRYSLLNCESLLLHQMYLGYFSG